MSPLPTTDHVRSWEIGDERSSRVVEIEGSSPGTFFCKDATPEKLLQHAWLKPHFMTEDGRLIASIHAFVIESDRAERARLRLVREDRDLRAAVFEGAALQLGERGDGGASIVRLVAEDAVQPEPLTDRCMDREPEMGRTGHDIETAGPARRWVDR